MEGREGRNLTGSKFKVHKSDQGIGAVLAGPKRKEMKRNEMVRVEGDVHDFRAEEKRHDILGHFCSSSLHLIRVNRVSSGLMVPMLMHTTTLGNGDGDGCNPRITQKTGDKEPKVESRKQKAESRKQKAKQCFTPWVLRYLHTTPYRTGEPSTLAT